MMPTVPQPQRHGCLLAYLILMLVANGLTCLSYLFAASQVTEAFPTAPAWLPNVLAVACLINIGLVIGLFRWKKWAFYLFCILAVVFYGVNLWIGIPWYRALSGLCGPALLFGVLHIGGPNKGWARLQ